MEDLEDMNLEGMDLEDMQAMQEMEDLHDPAINFFLVKIGPFERDVGLNVPKHFYNAIIRMKLEHSERYRSCVILAHQSLVDNSVPEGRTRIDAYFEDEIYQDSVTIVTLDANGDQDNRWRTFLADHGILLDHWILARLIGNEIIIRAVDPPVQHEVIEPAPFFVAKLTDNHMEFGLDIPQIFYDVHVAPQNVPLRVVRWDSGDEHDCMWVQLFRLSHAPNRQILPPHRLNGHAPDAIGWYASKEWGLLLENNRLKPPHWINVELRGTDFIVSEFGPPLLDPYPDEDFYPTFTVHLESDYELQQGLEIPQDFVHRTMNQFDVEVFPTRRVRLVEHFPPKHMMWEESAHDIWVNLLYSFKPRKIQFVTGMWAALLNKQNIKRGDWIRVYLDGYDFVITLMDGPPSPESPESPESPTPESPTIESPESPTPESPESPTPESSTPQPTP